MANIWTLDRLEANAKNKTRRVQAHADGMRWSKQEGFAPSASDNKLLAKLEVEETAAWNTYRAGGAAMVNNGALEI